MPVNWRLGPYVEDEFPDLNVSRGSESGKMVIASSAVIGKVLVTAIQVATHSWEYGTVSEAILEWQNASLSIWNNPFSDGQIPTLNIDDVPALTYVKPYIRTNNITLVDGDGAAGDPASLGIPAFLIGQTNTPYSTAATRQLTHLLTSVPRWPNGAISHREAYPELWDDFLYMAPPFLAYYAIATSNLTLLKEAAQQCSLYEEVLRDPQGPWLHIVGNHTNDRALWSTGNGWAAAGAARVLATMVRGPYAEETKADQESLTKLIKNIIDGAIKFDSDSSGLLRNYLNDTTWFGEISGTSMLAATAFRMAVLEPEQFPEGYTEWAMRKMEVVDSKIDNSTGIVTPAVNPLNWHDKTPYTSGSPEGQSFVVLLHAAYRDWLAAKN